MADYIALKACRFAGTAYAIGDTIPENVILPKRIHALIDIGIVAEMPQAKRKTQKSDSPIPTPIEEAKEAPTEAPTATEGKKTTRKSTRKSTAKK